MRSMTAEMPISPLEAHAGFWLRFVSNAVSASFRRRVEAHGVSVSDWVVLRHLHDASETSPAQLMDALAMTKGAVSKIVTRLEAGGLVRRGGTEFDRRAQNIVLTPVGRKLVPVLARVADENDALFFGHLPQAEREALVRLMRDLVLRHQLKQLPTE